MNKKTKYEKQADIVKEFCSDIDWEVNQMADILDARDYVEMSEKFIIKLSEINSAVQRLREEMEKS